MAANDYEVLDNVPMCPIGYLAAAIGPTDTAIEIVGFQSVEGADVDLTIGMAVMINDEIMRLNSLTLPTLSVSRGCADTLPAKLHPANSVVWFFDTDAGTDGREYTAASTIGVKLLPYTGGGGDVPIEHAPPHALTFNWRFTRPYPPADIRCNGVPWDGQPQGFDEASNTLNLSWVHRNRILQADQLIGHTEASVTPEAGTTYGITVHKQSGEVVRSVTVNSGTTWNYTLSQALSDAMGASGYIELGSQRDGFTSLQKRVIELVIGAGIPQISEFILSGTVDVGAVVTITLGTTSFTYTILAGDTIDTVAWKLAELIKANGAWVVSASNGVVLITGKSRSAFTISGSVVGSGGTTAAIVTITQAATTTLPQITEVDFDTTINDTLRLSVTIGADTFTYDVQAGEDAATALASLAAHINAANEITFEPNLAMTRVVNLNDGSEYLMEVGPYGSSPYSRTLVSSDGGLTFTNDRYSDSLWAGVYGVRFWDAKYGTRRFSILYNDTAFLFQVITQDGDAEPAITPRFARYPSTAYPTIGDAYGLNIFTAFADTDRMYIVGDQTGGAATYNARLYWTTDGMSATLLGEMALAAGVVDTYDGFHKNFRTYAWATQSRCKLAKYGSRWFLCGVYGLYCTDDAVPLNNWRPIDLGLGEGNGAPSLGFLEGSDNYIVCGTGYPYSASKQLAYSTDNGTTWSVVTMPTGYEWATIYRLVVTDDAFYAYGPGVSGLPTPTVLKASFTALGTWTAHTLSGVVDHDFYVYSFDGNVIIKDHGGDGLLTSTNGIDFVPTVTPNTVTVMNSDSVVAAPTADKLVLTGTTPNVAFTASAAWSLKPMTAMSYQTIRGASMFGNATGMGEAIGLSLGGLTKVPNSGSGGSTNWWSSYKVVSQAMKFPAIKGGDIFGTWIMSASVGFMSQYLVGRTLSTDAGVYASAELADSESRCVLWVGDIAYVASFSTTTPSVPAYLSHSYIHRLDPTSNTKVTWEAPTPGTELITSLSWDGSHLWSYGSKDGALRKHDPVTLDVLTTYNAPDLGGVGNGGEMVWYGGMAIVLSSLDEVSAYSPAIDSLIWTQSVPLVYGTTPILRMCGSLLFVVTMTNSVLGEGSVTVIDPSDGTVLTTYSDGVKNPGEHATGTTTDFGYAVGNKVRWLSGSTGAVVREVDLENTTGTFMSALDDAVITIDIASDETYVYYI